jgi:hypothetical protein
LRLALAQAAARRRTIDFPLDREGVMANDKSIELRVSLLEYQMETLVELVTEIRENYVTKQYLDERLLGAKEHVDERLSAADDRISALKEYLDERLSHYATKEDLERVNQNMRNWVITVGISATALQFAMQYALFQLYLHAR